MRTGQRDRLLNHFRRAALRYDGGGLTDGQLLACFVERRDQDAFAALVRRHGAMVLGVCRRVLRNAADAEDAFQATFLVLVRKAASLRSRDLVGNWLYGTAYRTALEARTAIARRQARERAAAIVPEAQAAPDEEWRELLPLLDREVSRLPEKYREAVVLCELQGVSRREAGRRLRLPEGTVSSRLAAARKLLARRLARHGVVLTGLSLAVLLAGGGASAGVPAALVASTARRAALVAGGSGATGVVSANVLLLMKGALKTMFLAKLETAAAVLIGVTVLGVGTGGLVYRAQVGAAEPHGAGAFLAAVPAKPGGVRDDPTKEEARQRALEREQAERQARDAEAEARAERDKAAKALEEARRAIQQAKAEADRARREAEAAREEALRERDRAEQALQQERKAQAEKTATGKERAVADDPGNKARFDASRDRLLAQTRAALVAELKQIEAERQRFEADLTAKQNAVMQQLKELEAEKTRVESNRKERPDDLKRGTATARPEAAPRGDKLDLILQRLEQMERRLDRLERGGRDEKRPAPLDGRSDLRQQR